MTRWSRVIHCGEYEATMSTFDLQLPGSHMIPVVDRDGRQYLWLFAEMENIGDRAFSPV